jgi:hypothetical protein
MQPGANVPSRVTVKPCSAGRFSPICAGQSLEPLSNKQEARTQAIFDSIRGYLMFRLFIYRLTVPGACPAGEQLFEAILNRR